MSSLNLRQLKADLSRHLQRCELSNPADSLSFLAHGEANVIFRLGKRQLVRVAVNTPNQRFGGDFSQLTGFEQAILRYLKGTGIGHELQTAQRSASPDFPYTYLITNYIEGDPLDYSRTQLKQCADTLARLHRLPRSPGYELSQLIPSVSVVDRPLDLFYQESKDYAQPYLDAADADDDVVEMIQAVLAKAQARLSAAHLLEDYPYRCLVHSDHTYENWVINDQAAYLIDWEWAEVGSPAGDLGHFLSPVTVCRRQGYQLPPEDRAFFLSCYYEALADDTLAHTIRQHFAAFGPFPAVRSLCWTAGYWVTACQWYAGLEAESDSAAERMRRLQESRDRFPNLWASVMTWLDEDI
ncbi:MAG: phosphotransferase [Phormidesmis sp.]